VEDVADHTNDKEFKLLRLDANAGEICVASDVDCSNPSIVRPGNSNATAELTATANTAAVERSFKATGDASTSEDTRVMLRDGQRFARRLKAFSSASATTVKPSPTKALDLGMGDAPELTASTSACTLRKLRRDASLGTNASGDLNETGAREKNGTCKEEPLT